MTKPTAEEALEWLANGRIVKKNHANPNGEYFVNEWDKIGGWIRVSTGFTPIEAIQEAMKKENNHD